MQIFRHINSQIVSNINISSSVLSGIDFKCRERAKHKTQARAKFLSYIKKYVHLYCADCNSRYQWLMFILQTFYNKIMNINVCIHCTAVFELETRNIALFIMFLLILFYLPKILVPILLKASEIIILLAQ